MKNFIFLLFFIVLFAYCKPENDPPGTTSNNGYPTARGPESDFIGNWEEVATTDISWCNRANIDDTMPMYQLFDDGTYDIQHERQFSFIGPGTWNYDESQHLITFHPYNVEESVMRYHWLVESNQNGTMTVIAGVEPQYQVNGVVPDPTYCNWTLKKSQ